MAESIFKKDMSFYDQGEVIKDVHDFYGQSLRVTDADSIVPSSYSHYDVTYDGTDRPTSIAYYRALTAQLVSLTAGADSAGSLNNKYFRLRSATDNKKYHVWFNVNGAGVDPAPVDSTEIEVALSTNDAAVVVAAGIVFMVNAVAPDQFVATRNGAVVQILNKTLGLVTAASDFNTGFSFTNTLGTQDTVITIDISYDVNSNPIYKGQTLVGYKYDIPSGKFIINSAAGSEGDSYKIVPYKFDEIEITAKTIAGDPQTIIYRNAGLTVATLTLTYDIDGDLEQVVRT